MSFHPRNKFFLVRNNSKKNLFLSIIAVIIFIAVFSLPWTKNILFSVGSPFWVVKNSTISFFSNSIGILNSKINLLNENGLLKGQIKSKEKNDAIFDLLKKENEDLKNILNRKNEDQKFLLGAVLVKPFLSPYDTLVIDVGLLNGVVVGDNVLAEGDTYIGYVSEVYNQT